MSRPLFVEPTPLWHRFAACRPEYADRPLDQWVDMFFPGRGASTTEVKAICAECPAQEACTDQAAGLVHWQPLGALIRKGMVEVVGWNGTGRVVALTDTGREAL